MSDRAQRIGQSIVETLGDQPDDYRRLRPIQKVVWSPPTAKWVYDPDPDFIKYLDTPEGKDFFRKNVGYMHTYIVDANGKTIAIEIDREQKLSALTKKYELDYSDFSTLPSIHAPHWVSHMKVGVEGSRQIVNFYNQWVRDRNYESGHHLVAKAPVDKGGKITVGEVAWADMPKHYERIYVPPLWDLEIQLIPRTRPIEKSDNLDSLTNFTDIMGVYGFEDEALFRAYIILKDASSNGEADFIKMLNLMLYDYIQGMRKIAEESGAWNKENMYWLPNMEFVQYFQKNNIDPKKEDRFEEAANYAVKGLDWVQEDLDEYTEKSMRRIFGGHQDFTKDDEDNSLRDLGLKAQDIKDDNKYYFDSYRDAYKEACNWWTLKGKPITWKQLEKAVHK